MEENNGVRDRIVEGPGSPAQHHEQSRAVQEDGDPSEDFWRPLASAFRADPHRTDDPLVQRLSQEVTPESTLLDVGAGAGRLALPLALRCRHVTAVEPSEAMLEELRQGAGEARLENLTIVPEAWEDAQVDRADIVLCAHVLYGVSEVDSFVSKLAAHANDRVLIPMFLGSPQSHLSLFWRAVYEEERVPLPALGEVLAVLWEMGINPDLAMVRSRAPQMYQDWEKAQQDLRFRLYVTPDSHRDRSLRRAMEELLAETSEGYAVRDAEPRHEGLLLWSTHEGGSRTPSTWV